MKFLLGLFSLLLMVEASGAATQDVVGKITKIRTTSDFHSHIPGRQEVVFQIDTGHATGCTWLGLPKENNTFTSFLLSAHATKSTVRVWYYSDQKTNSGGIICQAYTIELR